MTAKPVSYQLKSSLEVLCEGGSGGNVYPKGESSMVMSRLDV